MTTNNNTLNWLKTRKLTVASLAVLGALSVASFTAESGTFDELTTASITASEPGDLSISGDGLISIDPGEGNVQIFAETGTFAIVAGSASEPSSVSADQLEVAGSDQLELSGDTITINGDETITLNGRVSDGHEAWTAGSFPTTTTALEVLGSLILPEWDWTPRRLVFEAGWTTAATDNTKVIAIRLDGDTVATLSASWNNAPVYVTARCIPTNATTYRCFSTFATHDPGVAYGVRVTSTTVTVAPDDPGLVEFVATTATATGDATLLSYGYSVAR